jgi:PA14 domain/Fibronectin type III domain
MRKRNALSQSAPERIRLNCEALESREVPAANLMGINLSGVEDWSYDRMFADAIKSARRPSNFGSHEGTPPLDSHGWATTDFSIVLWHGIANMHGTYKLSFNGQADLSSYWGAATIANKIYNAAANTTTADLTYWPHDGSGLLLNFANTRREPGGSTDTGVTNIRLMRPISPGSTISYDLSVTFTQPLKDLVSHFAVVRMMDNTGSNGGLTLNGVWTNRRTTDYASQASTAAAKGMAWEYAIQFWNETDTDAWVNIPFPADDDYVTQLATLLKNNLEPGRKIYVEYSNELWNTWGPFPANANRDAAVAEVQANPNSPLNYDHAYPALSGSEWGMANRRIALRSVQVSDIFRRVFGDAAMMTRVRPVMMTQLGNTAWLAGALDFMEDYFDNPAYQATPHPASYYLYGAGGSAYEEPDWSIGNGITPDQIFATMPFHFAADLQADQDWVAAFGLKRIAYEGGPSLDNLINHPTVPDAPLDAAWADPRMETEVVENHNTWSANGGDLFMYFASTGDHEWGMTRDVFTPDTPKMRAVNDLNAAPAAAVTYGKLAPLDLVAADFTVPYWQGGIGDMRADSLTANWKGTTFRLDAAGSYGVRATATASTGGRVEVFVDGQSVGTIDVPSSGDTVTLPAGTLQPGLHGIVLRARAGSFGLSRVSVVVLTPAPGNLTATATSGNSVNLAWVDNSTNETGFTIDRATNASFSAGLSTFVVGPNVVAYTDSGLTAGTTYYYRVRATAPGGPSGYSNTASATTPGGNGLAATYFDRIDLTGPTVTRTDSTVNFYWPGSPATGIDGDTFSARWIGQVQAVETGAYQFRTRSDDGVRLWLNGALIVDNWTDHAETINTSAAVTLTAGTKYDIRLEFYDNMGGALMRLQWRRPGQSGFTAIPQSQLFPAPGGAALFADGFDIGTGKWTVVAGNWATGAQSGRDTVYATTGASLEELSLAGSASWTNYSVAAWVNLSSLGGGVSILGRVVDSTHFYQLEIKRDAAGNAGWFLIRREGTVWTRLASGSLQYNPGDWIRLRLTLDGNTLRAESSIDGTTYTALGSATDTRYTAGRVGLRAWFSAAYFDDVLVQSM